ncbi:Uu.00g104750.m01.CDS01 [Anthostomella pinea]|uniref:Uu.00g104750.m01.CDS01 n=1 Tax=Anthostomella pinea TaxID=933095 RepID=A0AAI8VDN5_9PEZI|nr:Uu.00g104750.m01.CDS01 [Anthostomella pinea]
MSRLRLGNTHPWMTQKTPSNATDDPEIARKREKTLFKKTHELHTENETKVFMLFYHYGEDRYYIYNTQPSENWPPTLQDIKTMYPLPDILTPEIMASHLEKMSKRNIGGDDHDHDVDDNVDDSMAFGTPVDNQGPFLTTQGMPPVP